MEGVKIKEIIRFTRSEKLRNGDILTFPFMGYFIRHESPEYTAKYKDEQQKVFVVAGEKYLAKIDGTFLQGLKQQFGAKSENEAFNCAFAVKIIADVMALFGRIENRKQFLPKIMKQVLAEIEINGNTKI